MNLRLPIHAAAFMLISGCNGCKSDVNVASTFEDTGEPFLADWGSWLSMDVMPDGSPAIAYYDATDGGLGFAIASIEDDGSVSWEREQVDGFLNADNLDTGDRGKYASMKIAADGLPGRRPGHPPLRGPRRRRLDLRHCRHRRRLLFGCWLLCLARPRR